MEDKLKALANAEDIDMLDIARRALRKYLDRQKKASRLNYEPVSIRKRKSDDVFPVIRNG